MSKQVEQNKIWQDISELPLNIFGLPNQKVSQHVAKLDIPGVNLFLRPTSAAVLPALETTLLAYGNKYTVQLATGGYLIVQPVDEVETKLNEETKREEKKRANSR